MKKLTILLLLVFLLIPMLISCECKHEYTSKVVRQPTCGADGAREFTCTKCGDSYQTAIPATGDHSYTSKITKEPSCTKEGTKTFTCGACGDSYTESIPATGEHSYKESVTKKATCTEDGVKTFKCKTCGDTYTEKIKAAHTWKDATCTEPKTCKVCGKKQGSALGHTTDNGKCSRCGETFVYGWTQSDMYDLYNYASEANKQYDIYMSSVGIKSSLYPSRGVTACAEMRKLLEKANAIVSRNNDLYFQDASTGEAADSLKQTMKKTMDDLAKDESECKKYLKSSGALDNFYVDTAVLTVTVDCLTLMKEVKVYYKF